MIIQPITDGLTINRGGINMKKILILLLMALIYLSGCTRPQHTFDINEVKGWELWENDSEVGIELQTSEGTWVLTKEPYTTEVTVTYEKN